MVMLDKRNIHDTMKIYGEGNISGNDNTRFTEKFHLRLCACRQQNGLAEDCANHGG